MTPEQTEEMHRTWHSFQKEFKENGGWKYDDNDSLMDAICLWADKQDPINFSFVSCDDSYHTSSDLILIHHIWTEEVTKHWWGTTVVFIAQCDGQPPAEFFLYPGHAKYLMNSLGKVMELNLNGK